MAALQDVLGIAGKQVILRTHERHRWGEGQYAREGEDLILEVREGDLRFEVNLGAHHDTGLFLDHRDTRAQVRRWAEGKRLLNLFCYTGAFTVAAAVGGARATTSVDLSAPYLAWTERNLERNEVGGARHSLVRADALQWLQEAKRKPDRFDLIVLDPPSFSVSKKMERAFEIQRDHPAVIGWVRPLLAPGGRLIFSTNYLQFQLDRATVAGLEVEELAALPLDFRGRKPHRCWSMVQPA
jgi:23S rRNA (cytosine1962-C5)-methyltransferase